MNSSKRKIEVFTSGCPLCEPVVKMVQDLACEYCEVITYNVAQPCDSKECLTKVKDYGIQKLPAIAIDGKLLDCCQQSSPSIESLQKAGVGVSEE